MKCEKCGEYTLEESCKKCNLKVSSAHYKFVKVRDAPKSNIEFWKKSRKN